MKLTENKLRRIVREEMEFMVRNRPNPNSLNGYKQKYMETTFRRLAQELKSAFDIEFEDPVVSKLGLNADFELYSKRQDIFKEGRIVMFMKDGRLNVQISGGPVGAGISGEQEIVDAEIGPNEDPLASIKPSAALRTLV